MFFVLAKPRHFWMGVDDGGDEIVTDVACLAVNDFCDHHPFFARFVGEHRAAHAVADGVHARLGGGAVFVNFDVAARVQFDGAGGVDGVCGVGFAADSDEEFIDGQGLFAVFVLVLHFDRTIFDARAAHFGAEADVQSLFFEGYF